MSATRKERLTETDVDEAALKRHLLRPPKWWPKASCRGMSADAFTMMPVVGVAYAELTGEEEAKAVCAACPVQSLCLDWALSEPLSVGIWGGLNEIERAQVRRARLNLGAVS